MAISSEKYFWEKKTHVFFGKSNRKSLKFFNKKILITSIPNGFLKIIGKQNRKSFLKKKKYFLLALGNVIVYNKEELLINIKSIKFKIKKAQNILHENVINIIQDHKILIDAGTCVQFLKLSIF
ncbi:hypothetical protein CPARA_1gp005 (nucleomorph) [Cryptomonas paramecium]|uniref:Uncharacterized protein n=1 Tax=Cryptomonas paramaecium TaxID=2898 RepID=F2HH67_9CRYP|nr:hypothetical protein CPARA_1gp005 [Cryptomonas paramecium]AEA38663.1 hypothetical protein CPARA_1gp005 [Cryptomonas paramecium]|mmetsp:Transcript_58660/g.155129  ORF Transcript_58660/g.155129 Transcript_58660/m.155129 type:complete len:124 (+) Transcript_58660:7922-8293(+)